MLTYLKLLQLYAKNAKEPTSNRLSFLGESHPYLPEQVNQDLFLSQSLNAQNADTLTGNSFRKNFDPLTDAYSGLHEYD